MELEEYFKYRSDLLDASKDDDGFVQQQLVLAQALPLMLDAKVIDSEDFNESYYVSEAEKLKLNAYVVNNSGERLQLFLVDEGTINENTLDDVLQVSAKAEYETQFKRVTRFISKAIKGNITDQIQDSDPVKALVTQLSSNEGIEQFDVIEIFLLSLTATVSFKGMTTQPRRIHFDDSEISTQYGTSDNKKKKTILVLRRVIDLNFLFDVFASRGHRKTLEVNFRKTFNYDIEVIQAAKEEKFSSYLCVLKADLLAELYKRHSSSLLEKNVRSFLQFKGVNRGIKETIRKEPERFIAYNNGLTITASSAKVFHHKKTMYIESVTDFQIVNGGQTTASIYFSKKEGLDISKVKVMAKINIINEESDKQLDDLISKISKFSNTQSRVSNVDLNSRSSELVKIKKLSERVVTPSGILWFFERARGEFNTKVRLAGANSNRIKKEYPNERRFSKEQLAKYYSAWGDIPHLVKKGGENIFRHFLEQVTQGEKTELSVEINRDFYEALVSKIIIFRRMEKIYGQGKNSMGQLRSAVIPYSMSVIYLYSDGSSDGRRFDLSSIWKNEGLEDDLAEYFRELLLLINELINKYAASDDYGEYSKKAELWISIKSCSEVTKFMTNAVSSIILKKYTLAV